MYPRLSCEQIEVGIAEYLDDALPPDLHRRFEDHLRDCAECREHLQRMRWTIDHLAAGPREPMPPEMKERILACARTGPASPGWSYVPRYPPLPHFGS